MIVMLEVTVLIAIAMMIVIMTAVMMIVIMTTVINYNDINNDQCDKNSDCHHEENKLDNRQNCFTRQKLTAYSTLNQRTAPQHRGKKILDTRIYSRYLF